MNDRIRHIDGLRGVAVLGVVLYHCGLHDAALANARGPLAFALRQGCHGVDLFFVLSGFCLSYPVLSRLHGSGLASFKIAGYAARRVVRIVPPYYAAILAFVALGAVLLALRVPFPDSMAPQALSAGGILKQMLFLDRDRIFLNGSFWTLAIEFRWYFLFPLMLALWIRFPKAFWALAAGAFIVSGATGVDNEDLFFLPFFMLGIVAAQLYVRAARLPRWALPGAALVLAAACLGSANGGWKNVESGPFWGVAMFALVVLVGATPALRAIASARWLVALGAASYGIYLIHEPVAALIERSAVPSIGSVAAYLLAFSSVMAIGFAFSYLAERPFVKSRVRDGLIAKIEPEAASMLARLELPGIVDFHHDTARPAQELVA